MKMLSMTLVGLLLGSSAFAIDPLLCPRTINVEMDSISAFKTSVHSKREGWKEANKTLSLYETPYEFNFKLIKTTKTVCVYKDVNGDYAKLQTLGVYDSEENKDQPTNFLALQFKDDVSTLGALLPVKSYDQDGVTLYSSDDKTRTTVRASLYSEEYQKTIYVEVGLARFNIK